MPLLGSTFDLAYGFVIAAKGKKGAKKRKGFDAELVDTSRKTVKKFRYGYVARGTTWRGLCDRNLR